MTFRDDPIAAWWNDHEALAAFEMLREEEMDAIARAHEWDSRTPPPIRDDEARDRAL